MNAFTLNLQDGITLAQGCPPHFGSGPSQTRFGTIKERVWDRNNIYTWLCCLLTALSHQTPRMSLHSIRSRGAFLKLHCRQGAENPCFKLLRYQKTSRVSWAFIQTHNLSDSVRMPCSGIRFYPAPGTPIILPNQSPISAR